MARSSPQHLVLWYYTALEGNLQCHSLLIRRVRRVMSNALHVIGNQESVYAFHDPGLIIVVGERDVCDAREEDEEPCSVSQNHSLYPAKGIENLTYIGAGGLCIPSAERGGMTT